MFPFEMIFLAALCGDPPSAEAKPVAPPTEKKAEPADAAKKPETPATIKLPDTVVRQPVDLFEVVVQPIRDSYQLLPWDDTPVEPAPKVKDLKDVLGASVGVMDDTPDEKALWKWRAEGGGNFRQGNTNTNNLHTEFTAERRSNLSMFATKFGATYNQVDGGQTNRRFIGNMTYDKYLRGRWLFYGREELENDEVRRIELRSITSVGLGYRLIDALHERWLVRTGPTGTYLLQNPDNAPRTSMMQSGWLAESEYRRVLWENSRFEWTLSTYPNFATEQSFRIKNDVSLLFPIGGVKSCWNWKLGARHEYTQNPAPGTKPNDIEAYFSIVYGTK